MQNDDIERNEPPRLTWRQQIVFWASMLLITVAWTALVTTLAVAMIRLGIPEVSPNFSESDYFYDIGIW